MSIKLIRFFDPGFAFLRQGAFEEGFAVAGNDDVRRARGEAMVARPISSFQPNR